MPAHRSKTFSRLAASLRKPAARACAALSLACGLSFAPAHAAGQAGEAAIGPGDIVRFSVFQNQDLTTEARVAETGAISFPLIGQVKVGGLTPAEAEKRIADQLREGRFVKDPQVMALVVQMRSNLVSVLGNVNRPGRYPIEVAGMRLSEVIAEAGGTVGSGGNVITLVTRRDGRTTRRAIDLHAALEGTGGEDPLLAAGDVAYVERQPTVYIHGEVQRPGELRLDRELTVMQALAAGGGLTLRGTTRGLRVHRRMPSGEMQELRPGPYDKLQDGDVVHVQESLF